MPLHHYAMESYRAGIDRVKRLTDLYANQVYPATTDFRTYKTIADALRDRKHGENIYVITDDFQGWCCDKPITGIKL